MATKAPTPLVQKDLLKFEFDATWDLALQWDDAVEFQEGLKKRATTRAVDIVGARRGDEIWFIEVKDPRGAQVADANRRAARPYVEITSTKVRDSIAGLIWAIQRFAPDRCLDLATVLFARKKSDSGKIVVILWLEGIDEAAADAIRGGLMAKLKWLNAKVLVTDRRLWPRAPEDLRQALTVTSMPGAPPIASK